MAADARRTAMLAGPGDARRPSFGGSTIPGRSLPAFGDGMLGIYINNSAQEARFKMKNNKALVINEGSLLMTKKIIPDNGKGKGILVDNNIKTEKSFPILTKEANRSISILKEFSFCPLVKAEKPIQDSLSPTRRGRVRRTLSPSRRWQRTFSFFSLLEKAEYLRGHGCRRVSPLESLPPDLLGPQEEISAAITEQLYDLPHTTSPSPSSPYSSSLKP
ncbi:hypothetical protein MA16_Dca014961 [Dendrobium catenatum]|uniref:Uncharacterized protein n=1 Tax=Dendrobium catenatum TaxID=906689 RepID=A0A2I0V9I5_9ASPA|nr:hypothetical protein MA16_Dca014961 [Dendrobium catenatum]